MDCFCWLCPSQKKEPTLYSTSYSVLSHSLPVKEFIYCHTGRSPLEELSRFNTGHWACSGPYTQSFHTEPKCFLTYNHTLMLPYGDPLMVSCWPIHPGSLASGDRCRVGPHCVGLANLHAGIAGTCFYAWLTISALRTGLYPRNLQTVYLQCLS